MRLLDRQSNRALKNVVLYLTLDEANELFNDLKNLIENFGNNEHAHINDLTYEHEITIVLYSENYLDGFDERSKALISKDV